MATIGSSILTFDESPSAMWLSPLAPASWMTATSWVRSYPTTDAWYVRPLTTDTALMSVAPAITWLLVSTRPVELRRMPVPAARAFCRPRTVLTSTTDGLTILAMAVPSTSGLPVFVGPPPDPSWL